MGLKISLVPEVMGRWYLRLTVNTAMGCDTSPQDDTNGLSICCLIESSNNLQGELGLPFIDLF